MKISKGIGSNVRIITTLVIVALITCVNSNSIAQSSDFPINPIKSIVTYPAGESSTFLARIMGKKLAAILGQSNIKKKNGVAGAIGCDELSLKTMLL